MSIEHLHIAISKFEKLKSAAVADVHGEAGELIREAYAIQREIDAMRAQAGNRQVGYKVGCISNTIQRALNIRQPIFGRLYASECWSSDTALSLQRFEQLAVEGELAVILSESIFALNEPNTSPEDIIQSVFPVIELHHYSLDESLTAADMIARNAIHAGFVHGETSAGNCHFPDWLSIKLDDTEVACVSRDDLIRTVNNSLRWLASALQEQNLQAHADQIILCGSAAPLFPLKHGGCISVVTSQSSVIQCSIKS